jgi:hypothetical protein
MKELFIEAPNEAAHVKPSLEEFRSAADSQLETAAGGLATSGKGQTPDSGLPRKQTLPAAPSRRDGMT